MEGAAVSDVGEVKVLSTWISMFGMRVVIALNEKAVPYQYSEEDLSNKSQLLLQSNPVHKKIPVLLHNGKPICESNIIVQYIDETWPSPPFFNPPTPYNRAMHLFWADFVDKKFYAEAGSKILRSIPGEERDKAVEEFKKSYKMMEKALGDMACGKPFFGGDSIGFLDIAFAPFICWFNTFEAIGEFKLPGEEECPLLSEWVKKVSQVPSVAKALPHPDKLLEFVKGVIAMHHNK